VFGARKGNDGPASCRVPAVPGVEEGDEAVIVVRGSGNLARELAELAGTISWDIFTGIGPRAQRSYF
jgi:alanine racemase